jgi:hypothetical protein
VSKKGVIIMAEPSGARPIPLLDLFDNLIDGVRVINVHPFDEVLVIKGGDYFLDENKDDEGTGLDLFAGIVRLEGNAVIKSFTSDCVPADDTTVAGPGDSGYTGAPGGLRGDPGGAGGQGKTGATGRKGADAKRITLRIGKLEGDGTLTVINEGMRGGRAGKGGPGGPGGGGGWAETEEVTGGARTINSLVTEVLVEVVDPEELAAAEGRVVAAERSST